MKITRNDKPLFDKVDQAFPKAVDDLLTEARANAQRNERTGKFRGSLRTEILAKAGQRRTAIVGSPLVSARAKEKGAFIQPKQGDRLFIPQDGELRTPTQVRIRATPVVTPAGEKWPELMTRRLQEVAR
jgi:hypothetical protein